MRPLSLAVVLSTSALSGLVHAQLGAVVHEGRIAEPSGSNQAAFFGQATAVIDDLDGNGVVDLAVGAPSQEGEGALWILFLDASGATIRTTRIGEGAGGFTGILPGGGLFAARVAWIGDLDGDGRGELAVSGNNNRPGRVGGVHILFLNADGTVRAQTRIAAGAPVFGGAMGTTSYVYGALSGYPDIDGDSIPELLWGDPEADDGAVDSGALWVVRLNADGSAKAAHRIANGQGGFQGFLPESADFALGIARIGDLDGNGVEDIVVGDNYAGWAPSGRVWTLFLDGDAQVIRENVFTAADLDLSWESDSGFVSHGSVGPLEAIDDLDGDGVRELAIGAANFRIKGGVAIAFLDRDGALRKRLLLAQSENGLEFDRQRGRIGSDFAFLGDLDDDGLPELAVGDTDYAAAGAVSILSLDASPVRNGSGINPLTLSEQAEPVIGRPWKLELDCSAHAAGDAFFLVSARPLDGILIGAGELLVDPGALLLFVSRHHGGNTVQQTIHLPPSLSVVNLVLHVQGACSGAPGLTLSNALDVVVGR